MRCGGDPLARPQEAYTARAMHAPPPVVRFAPFAALLALCVMLYLPGLASLPVTDRDEARFAQATRQMIESGDYVSIRFQSEPRHKKPVGIHWAQALSVRMFQPFAAESAIWPYRVPSAIGATLAVLLCFALLRPHIGVGAALLAAALLASSLLLIAEAHLATTDALLLATIVAAQGALMNRVLRPDHHPRAWSLLFWVVQALGILIKGPVAPLVSILTLIGWRLGGNRLRPLSLLHWRIGVPVLALIIAPWLIAVSRATGGSFLRDAWLGDLLPKLVSGHESHGFPPGFYLLLVTLTFWPGSLLAGFAVVSAWRHRADPAARFLLAWLIPSWIAFEVIPTKLPHYVLPLYPALAAMTAIFAMRCEQHCGDHSQRRPGRRSPTLGWVVWSIVTLALLAVAAALPLALDGRFNAWSILPAAAALVAVAAGFSAVRRADAPPAGLSTLVLCSAAFAAPLMAGILPDCEALWPSRGAARLVRSETGEPATRPWAACGYHEPSLVFHLGTDTRLVGPAQAADALAAGSVGGAIVEEAQQGAFEARAQELNLLLRQIGVVQGWNVSKGQRVVLRLWVERRRTPSESGG